MADYIDAALSALQAHLQAALDAGLAADAVPVRIGWPGEQEPIPGRQDDVEDAAHVALTASSDANRVPIIPVPTTLADGVQTYRVAEWSTNGQIDVFADYRDQLPPVVGLISDALTTLPHDGGLSLTMTDYGGEKCRIVVVSDARTPDNGPMDGDWRAVFQIRISGWVTRGTAMPTASTVHTVIGTAPQTRTYTTTT